MTLNGVTAVFLFFFKFTHSGIFHCQYVRLSKLTVLTVARPILFAREM